MTLTILSESRCFAGVQRVYSHLSRETGTPMRLAVYLPPAAERGPGPALIFLSGLTCTEDNFTVKAGAQRFAAEHGLMLVAPDTSPRGDGVPDDPAYDLGQGASFYLDATQAPWSQHFHMQRYIADELPALLGRQRAVEEEAHPAPVARGGAEDAGVDAQARQVVRFQRLAHGFRRCLLLPGGFSHAGIGVDPGSGDALDPRCAVLVPAGRLTPRPCQPLLGVAGKGLRGAVFSVRSPMLDRVVSIVVVETTRKRVDVVRDLFRGLDLAPLVEAFDGSVTLTTGASVTAEEFLGDLPGLADPGLYDRIADRLGAATVGERAGAIELALEGLYLSRRLSKETGDGAAVYG